MPRWALAAALLGALLFAGVGPASAQTAAEAPPPDTLAKLRRTGTIALGHRDAAVPLSYLVGEQPVGYSVDLCLAIVEGLKRRLNLGALKVQWVKLSAAERLPAVQGGRVDLECGSTTATAERRKSVSFAVPTFIAGAGVLAVASTQAKTLQDLRGKRVLVSAGTTGEKIVARANEAQFGLNVVVVKDNAEAFAALESGRAEAYVTDDILLAAFRAQSKDPARYALLEKRHTIEPLALMLRKDDAAFEAAVDAELAALIRSGDALQLYLHWFTKPIPPRNVNLELPASRLLRETFRMPLKMRQDVDVIIL